MASIFLSHTSIDKPFVEKLAHDMRKYGIQIWYDKYEIKVGESIFWKIDEGIRDTDYLGIVISKEAWESEWVRKEVSSAWTKQMRLKKNLILPIMYRDCEIPLMLQDLKYADFRTDYENGLKDLLAVFNVKSIDALGEDSWRGFVGKDKRWKKYQRMEFEKLVTSSCKIAKQFGWSVWVGSSRSPFSVCFSMYSNNHKLIGVAVKMVAKDNYNYYGTIKVESNPNNICNSTYSDKIGISINEVEEYIFDNIQDLINRYGLNQDEPYYYTERFLNKVEKREAVQELSRKMNWDQGVGKY